MDKQKDKPNPKPMKDDDGIVQLTERERAKFRAYCLQEAGFHHDLIKQMKAHKAPMYAILEWTQRADSFDEIASWLDSKGILRPQERPIDEMPEISHLGPETENKA